MGRTVLLLYPKPKSFIEPSRLNIKGGLIIVIIVKNTKNIIIEERRGLCLVNSLIIINYI